MKGFGIACSSIMRLNESERKQRPLTPSQKTMALLVEAVGMMTWCGTSFEWHSMCMCMCACHKTGTLR